MNFISSIRFSVFVCAVLALSVSASAQTTHYVSLDGECGGNTPCHATIQAAVNASASGDEIIVAPGTYAGFTNNSISVLTVRSSGGRDVTTLDGGGTAPVITLSGSASHTTLQGFTITNGHTNFGGGVHLPPFGGGASANIDDCIFLNNTAIFDGGAIGGPHTDLVITNCLFIGNSAGDNGGALALFDWGSPSLHIADCDFQNNTAGIRGGAMMHRAGNDTLVGCTFEGNSAPGGGAIWAQSVDATSVIDDCHFTNNSATEGDGGAIRLQSGSSIAWDFITNCTFTSNTAAVSGGGVFLLAAARMTGSTLTGNTAATGGGAALSGNATIDNCTISDNESTGDGGGVRLVDDASIINSIVTGNIAGGNGGGLWLNQTSATASAISGNTAEGNGGGLYMIAATATDCPITGNAATGRGGGVYAQAGASHLVNCEISTNTAGTSGGGMYINDAVVVNLTDSTVCMNTPDQIDIHIGALLMPMNVIGCEITCPSGGDPIGACCLAQGGCATLSEADCIAVGGTYQSDGVSCAKVECVQPCLGDLNSDDVVDIDDLFILLSAWGACP